MQTCVLESVCTSVCTCACECKHVCSIVCALPCAHARVSANMCARVCTRVCACACEYKHVCSRVCALACAHARVSIAAAEPTLFAMPGMRAETKQCIAASLTPCLIAPILIINNCLLQFVSTAPSSFRL